MRLHATAGTHRAVVEVRAAEDAFTAVVDGRPVRVEIVRERGALWTVLLDGRRAEVGVVPRGGGYVIEIGGRTVDVALQEGGPAPGETHPRAAAGPARVTAPMPGRIMRVLVAVGDEVRAGQGLVVMEAMKMENEIRSPRDGRVSEVLVRDRQAVETGALLAVLEPPQA